VMRLLVCLGMTTAFSGCLWVHILTIP
jgi:hypothetical protein